VESHQYHIENVGNLSLNSLVEFTRIIRDHGLKTGTGELTEILHLLDHGIISDKMIFKYSLRAMFCGCQADLPVFNQCFDDFWRLREADMRRGEVKVVDERKEKNKNSSLIFMGMNKNKESGKESEDSKSVSGANKMERLRETDFCKISEIDFPLFEEIAEKLFKEIGNKLKRRQKLSPKGKKISLDKTIRKSISKGGWPSEMIFKNKKTKKRQLVILLDISGSMDKYSFFLLRFIMVVKQYFKNLEVYTFSTSLDCITPLLNSYSQKELLASLGEKLQGWSGGTKIGECLNQFYSTCSHKILSGSSSLIIFSDGLDTGENNEIVHAMENIRKKVKRLIWLNPLKGMQGYQPIQRGMKRALPYVDDFMSAHNLNSLSQLEKVLINV